MITGELKSKIDRIWDTMWSGGISNPLSVIEQLTYLLFIKRLDELQTLKEAKSARTGQPIGALMTFARQLVHLLDALACYIGYLWPLWDAKRQTFADKIMSTVVIPHKES